MKRFLYTVVLSTALVSLSPAQTFVVLHTFTGTPDGATPYGALIRDTKSNLYGTTALGGTYNAGTVFKLRATGTEAASYSFGRSGDGYGPVAGLVRDRAGNLYGTTAGGGAWGNGAVFKIDISGKETLLYSFKATYSGDGAAPGYGSLLLDSAADLYGTTASGGLGGCGYDEFCGTVFKVDLGGNETVLYRFGGVDDGWGPLGGLIQDPAGNLYGTTPNGGPYSNPCGNTGCGVVFKLTPVGVETRLYSFGAFSGDASGPTATLVRDTKGNLYGTSVYGGTNFAGTVFRLTGGGMESVLHSFLGENSNGAFPRA